MTDREVVTQLELISQKLSGLVSVVARSVLVSTGRLPDEAVSLDTLLADAGLSQGEVAKALGKSQPTVSRQIKRDLDRR